MDKEEIIRRLKRLSKHAVHVVGELPYIMSLDDGIALDEAVRLLEEQEPVKPEVYYVGPDKYKFYCCPVCKIAWYYKGNYCLGCGKAVK